MLRPKYVVCVFMGKYFLLHQITGVFGGGIMVVWFVILQTQLTETQVKYKTLCILIKGQRKLFCYAEIAFTQVETKARGQLCSQISKQSFSYSSTKSNLSLGQDALSFACTGLTHVILNYALKNIPCSLRMLVYVCVVLHIYSHYLMQRTVCG